MALPATDLRWNIATWAVPTCLLPAVGAAMGGIDGLSYEVYDPQFLGQQLETYYFDTRNFDLRKARAKGDRYLTLRLREYGGDRYAISVKTEDSKFRSEVDNDVGEALAEGGPSIRGTFESLLPAVALARLQELTGDDPLFVTACIRTRRYAVEEGQGQGRRITLDTEIITDTGLCLPESIVEFKSTSNDDTIPVQLQRLNLHPCKLSKFLWSTHHSAYGR